MLEWLLLHTLTVTLLAGLAYGLPRCRRLSPAAQHLLWLVVLVKLVTPPVLSWPWALPDPRHTPAAPLPQQPVLPSPEPEVDDLVVPLNVEMVAAPPAAEIPPQAAALPHDGPPTVPAEPETPRVPEQNVLPELAVFTWIAGGMLVAAVQAVRLVRLRRRLRGAGPAPAALEQQVREAAASLGVRPIPVQVVPVLASPMLCGLGRARLLWPEGLEASLGPDGQRAVLVHELAHLRRRDHWTKWLVLAAGCLWWWHPLYWLVRRQLGRAAELACDAWVVATLPDARRAYAEALLEVALRGSWTAAAEPVLGAAGSRRDFERRLIMILRESSACRLSLVAVVAAVALAVLALPGWTLESFGQAPPAADQRVVDPLPTIVAVPPVMPQATPSATTTPVPQAGGDAAARDKKIRDLEEKIRVLVKQLHELRGDMQPPAGVTVPPMVPVAPGTAIVPAAGPVTYYYQPVTSYRDGKTVTTYQLVVVPGPETEVNLTRVIYKLPAAKAEALASFLKEHVKAAVLETRVEGDTVTITTTPEMQRTIGQFVALLRTKSDSKAETRNPLPR
jgi:beta-lactamase regulating signal transducer with metallopeptidase domain